MSRLILNDHAMESAGFIPSQHALFTCRRSRPNETMWQYWKRALLEQRRPDDPCSMLGFTIEMQRWCAGELQEPVRIEYLVSMTGFMTTIFGASIEEQPNDITYKRTFVPYLAFGNADDLLLFKLFWT